MSNVAILENAHNIGGKKFATIPVSEIKIDAGYQRRLREKVNKMVANWDYNLCDVVLVSYRNNKFYVIDGQHRVAAAISTIANTSIARIVTTMERFGVNVARNGIMKMMVAKLQTDGVAMDV